MVAVHVSFVIIARAGGAEREREERGRKKNRGGTRETEETIPLSGTFLVNKHAGRAVAAASYGRFYCQPRPPLNSAFWFFIGGSVGSDGIRSRADADAEAVAVAGER